MFERFTDRGRRRWQSRPGSTTVSQMFERFTDRARRVVVLAQEEARLLNHNYIGTEHILLGLIGEGEGSPPRSWSSWGGAAQGPHRPL